MMTCFGCFGGSDAGVGSQISGADGGSMAGSSGRRHKPRGASNGSSQVIQVNQADSVTSTSTSTNTADAARAASEAGGEGTMAVAKKSLSSPNRRTALHLAAESGHIGVLQTLLETMLCSVLAAATGANEESCSGVGTGAGAGASGVASGEEGEALAGTAPAGAANSAVTATGTGMGMGDSGSGDGGLQSISSVLNAKDSRGQTPLLIAAARGHTDCVRFLLSNGADRTVGDAKGNTPLHVSAARGFLSIVLMLCAEFGEEAQLKRALDAPNAAGFTPLHHAVWGRQGGAVQILLQHGADMMAKNTRAAGDIVTCPPGTTPLHLAACRGHMEISRILLKSWMDHIVEPMLSQSGGREESTAAAIAALDPRSKVNSSGHMAYQLAQRLGFYSLALLLRPTVPITRLFSQEERNIRFYGPPQLKAIAAAVLNRHLVQTLDKIIEAQGVPPTTASPPSPATAMACGTGTGAAAAAASAAAAAGAETTAAVVRSVASRSPSSLAVIQPVEIVAAGGLAQRADPPPPLIVDAPATMDVGSTSLLGSTSHSPMDGSLPRGSLQASPSGRASSSSLASPRSLSRRQAGPSCGGARPNSSGAPASASASVSASDPATSCSRSLSPSIVSVLEEHEIPSLPMAELSPSAMPGLVAANSPDTNEASGVGGVSGANGGNSLASPAELDSQDEVSQVYALELFPGIAEGGPAASTPQLRLTPDADLEYLIQQQGGHGSCRRSRSMASSRPGTPPAAPSASASDASAASAAAPPAGRPGTGTGAGAVYQPSPLSRPTGGPAYAPHPPEADPSAQALLTQEILPVEEGEEGGPDPDEVGGPHLDEGWQPSQAEEGAVHELVDPDGDGMVARVMAEEEVGLVKCSKEGCEASLVVAAGGVNDWSMDEDEDECGVCLEHPALVVISPCAHILCGQCARKMCSMSSTKPSSCPFCRSLIASFSPRALAQDPPKP